MEGLAKRNSSRNEVHVKKNNDKRKHLQSQRSRIALAAEPLKLFAKVIAQKDVEAFSEFQHYLEVWKTRYVKNLYTRRQVLLDKIKELGNDPTTELSEAKNDYIEISSAIDEYDVSLDTFWSEIMHMYTIEAKTSSNVLQRCCSITMKTAKEVYLEYLKQGYAMQLLQGKPLQMAGLFIESILQELDAHHCSGSDLLVVSVVGEQSSGKSTLLNSMFGCGFATRHGRCTKGLFASYLRLSTKQSLLVLDSEGLLSLDGGRVFDGQITLLALACSDLVIINHKGEISTQFNELLQVCLYAMDTLKVAKIKPDVAFVLRDQRNCRDYQVHQTALLKMQEAIRKAVSTSTRKVDDLIGIGKDSLFLLHSAFSEQGRGSRSIEMPSSKFSRETFLLRKKIIQAMGKGKVAQITSRGTTSRPLQDWYHNACYVWKTLTEYGHSLLYCKTVQEIRLRQELGTFVDVILKNGLHDESQGFKRSAAISLKTHRKELDQAKDEEAIDRIDKNFKQKLNIDMEMAIFSLEQQFEEKASGKQYEDFKQSCRPSLSTPVRHEHDFQIEAWNTQVESRRKALHLETTARFFEKEITKLLQDRKYQKGVKREEAETLFSMQWEKFEPEALRRIQRSETIENLSAKVVDLYGQVASTTKYSVNEKTASVPIIQARRLNSDDDDLLKRSLDLWIVYVQITQRAWYNPKRYLGKDRKSLALEELNSLHHQMDRQVRSLTRSLNTEMQPLSHKLVRAVVNEAVSTVEKAEQSFNSKYENNITLRTTKFLSDFVTTLMWHTVTSLQMQQRRQEIEARHKLLLDKDLQKSNFLSIVAEGQDDVDRAGFFVKMFKDKLSSTIETKLNDIVTKLRSSIKDIFGADQKKAAFYAYNVSFVELNYDNIVMYCMDVNLFLYKLYAKRFAKEKSKCLRDDGSELVDAIGDAFSQLDEACVKWPPRIKGEKVTLKDFKTRLTVSSTSKIVVDSFPIVANYSIGNPEIFCLSIKEALSEIKKKVVEELQSKQLPKTLESQKLRIWESSLKGCPFRCPRCGVKCEGATNHDDNHFVANEMHIFPSFNKWALIKNEKDHVHLGLCLDPKQRSNTVHSGGKTFSSVDEYLEKERPRWLPFKPNPDFARPSESLKTAWVNCRRALIHLRSSKFDVIDDTPDDWIKAYREKEKEVTENDIERLRKKLEEEP